MPDHHNEDNTQTYISLTAVTVVGHYCINQRIGAGGMGEVYLAEDKNLKRSVALKFLPKRFSSNDELTLRFKREAEATARLNHANIVMIHYVGEFEDRPYIAMEHVDGISLCDLLQKETLDFKKAMEGLLMRHKTVSAVAVFLTIVFLSGISCVTFYSRAFVDAYTLAQFRKESLPPKPLQENFHGWDISVKLHAAQNESGDSARLAGRYTAIIIPHRVKFDSLRESFDVIHVPALSLTGFSELNDTVLPIDSTYQMQLSNFPQSRTREMTMYFGRIFIPREVDSVRVTYSVSINNAVDNLSDSVRLDYELYSYNSSSKVPYFFLSD